MMMKKFSCLMIAIYLLLSLTGCQLARDDVHADADRLVGVVLTREYLDLFDMEAYLNDNLNFTGREIQVDGDTKPYQGRIYASLRPEENDQDTLYFHDINGIQYIAARIEKDGETYNRVYSDNAILNGKSHYNYTDTEETVTITGEILMVHKPGTMVTYINPVYQESDGDFYLMAGSGISTDFNNATGALMTQTMDSTTTVTEGDETKTVGVSISISIGSDYEPKLYRIMQMDKYNQIVHQAEYQPGNLPKELNPESDTEYLIVEKEQKLTDEVTRELVNDETDVLTTLFASEDGYLTEDYTTIQWE